MARLLFTVSDTFTVRGRGLVALPGIHPIGEERFRVGDRVLLKLPDGSQRQVTIDGLEFMNPNPHHDIAVLLKGLSKEELPLGTQVWSIDAA